ncbi:MAG: galactokinase [Erythrobacter sp.]|jgi:galactokinase|uniref:galactokinase n=1 Tax=Erythrobacter sp. TaxID=1042 RepID=UPI002B4A43AA|nr:galactokinase [Erythrobacter sp.]WRH70038.1 MAG: galactokinase [Erythrobacter sp.]
MNRREALIARVIAGYRAAYGEAPQALYAAPGRVNLIGEHVDYNDGLVLPCAIDRETIVAIGESPEGLIETAALDMGARDSFDPAAPIAPCEHEWANHVRGVAHFIREGGHPLAPARMAVAGDVPIGAGLSSSASFGVASALALSAHAGHDLPPATLALIAQAAENHFAGCACGIMDQMASAASTTGSALLLDCRTLETRAVPLHAGLAITVIDSGLRRSLTESAFNQRRSECEAAARHYGVASLRDLTPGALAAGRAGLDEVLFLRARHVVAEIARVEAVAAALGAGDTAAIARLLAEGHRSLAQDFAVSLPALDALAGAVQAALGERGGVRLTGAGFGGCLVAVSDAAALPVIDEAVAGYNARADVPAATMRFAPGPGAARIAL